MTDNKKNIVRLIPGESVPQFGGMTPEQMGDFAGQVESIVLGTFGSADGAMTLYCHLACRLLMDVQEAAGDAAMETTIETFNAALRDEIAQQKRRRAAERQTEPVINSNKGLH